MGASECGAFDELPIAHDKDPANPHMGNALGDRMGNFEGGEIVNAIRVEDDSVGIGADSNSAPIPYGGKEAFE